MNQAFVFAMIGSLALSGCSTLKPTSDQANTYAYGTKTPYQPQENLQNYSPAPSGYSLVYMELLSRHGSRALSKPKYDDISLKVWQIAKAQNALTPLGEKLGPEIERLMTANQRMGYGNLSALGEKELTGMGARMAERDHVLITNAVKDKREIAFEYSGIKRAKDSGLAFVSGLESVAPAITPFVLAPKKDKAELYFHKQKANQYYQDYKDKDPELRAAINALYNKPETKKFTREMLEKVYSPAFVDQLSNGNISVTPSGKSKSQTVSDLDAAMDLFNLYLIAPGLALEAGNQPWQFKQFVTPQESQWFTYLLDAENFYEKGPSFSDTDITYRMAKVLEDDFFKEVKGIQDGSNDKAAKIRFSHAEIIMPFAAQMHLQGSEKGVSRQEGYTLENSPWRGHWVAPYSANIQWDVYRNNKNILLVRMLYNEKEIPFKASCQPIAKGSYFYRFDELTRCYNESAL